MKEVIGNPLQTNDQVTYDLGTDETTNRSVAIRVRGGTARPFSFTDRLQIRNGKGSSVKGSKGYDGAAGAGGNGLGGNGLGGGKGINIADGVIGIRNDTGAQCYLGSNVALHYGKNR